MQYEVKVPTYKRVNKRKLNLESDLATIIVAFIIGITLGRVNLSFVEGLTLAPFGIAYLLSTILKRREREYLTAFISVILGYLSTYKVIDNAFIYLIIALSTVIYGHIMNKLDKKISKKVLFLLSIIIYVSLGTFVGNQGLSISFGFSLIEAISIIPFFYMINYGINCLSEIRTNYIFSVEELISIAIILCLIVAGIGGVEVFGVNIRNLLGIMVVTTIAYSGGISAGTIIGVTMGIIIGITTGDLLWPIGIYSICGLIVGIFKDTGKVFSVLAYVISYFLVVMYSDIIGLTNILEVSISAIWLFLIPNNFIKNILAEINNEEKSKSINEIQIQGIKNEFMDRLDGFKNILNTISSSLNNLSENNNLLIKNKSVALIENLADRVCSNCELNNKCWGRELHTTFSCFGELIGSCENGKIIIPKELDRKCVKLNTLLKGTENLLNNYTINENVKSRLVEGRRLIANQMNNMSIAMDDIIRDFEKDVTNCMEVDKLLRKTFAKNNIRYNEVYSYTDRCGHLKIKVKRENCEGCNYCIKNVLPVISDLIKLPLSLTDDGCRINPNNNECTFVIEETPKYNILSYAAFTPKDGEKYSGDTFSFGKNKNGLYVTTISDGMGSGPEAGAESNITVNLIEKFIEQGFDEATSLNTINSIMGMKFNEDEKFTTLDMNTIDLYTGDISFVKVGGVVSFIKRGNEVEVIESSELPFGILDSIEVKKIKRKIKHGDIIVTITDGILDIDKNNAGNYKWVKEYLEKSTTNPEYLSRDILEKAKELCNGKIFDDMTVVVSKAYSIY